MENNNVVMFLLVIIVILAAVFGIMFFQSLNAKEPTKVKIISNKTQDEGGKLAIQLTDLNKTPISKEKVNINITNKKDKVVVNKTVTTNSEGKAKLDLDLKKGKYTVNVTYGGNKNYTGNKTTQNLTIKEEVKEPVVDTNKYPNYSRYFGYYRIVETQQELAVVETSNGNYYVFAGDGAYSYAGHDSKGYIQPGNRVGEY